ncbi:MAG: SDR family NAD(P)-dependent oxidoreductase [Acidimicrobiales bacterium]
MDRPVAIVTGGGTGIGAATARRLASDAYRVVVCGRRASLIEAVASEIGGLAIRADVTQPTECERCVSETVKELGRLDGLVLNAGTGGYGSVTDLSVSTWQTTIETNLSSAFYMCRVALPHLIASGGALVAVASIAALRTGPSAAAYSASKAGLVALIRSIAVDYGPRGVRANVVCPGWVCTEMADEEMTALGGDREAAYKRVTWHVPQRRPGTPAEVAASIAWLLSEEASYVNGTSLMVDGGTKAVDAGSTAFLTAGP